MTLEQERERRDREVYARRLRLDGAIRRLRELRARHDATPAAIRAAELAADIARERLLEVAP